jgi:hypothetical protein
LHFRGHLVRASTGPSPTASELDRITFGVPHPGLIVESVAEEPRAPGAERVADDGNAQWRGGRPVRDPQISTRNVEHRDDVPGDQQRHEDHEGDAGSQNTPHGSIVRHGRRPQRIVT